MHSLHTCIAAKKKQVTSNTFQNKKESNIQVVPEEISRFVGSFLGYLSNSYMCRNRISSHVGNNMGVL